MNHNYVKSRFLMYFLMPIAILCILIDITLEDWLPERYLPPKLVRQVWGERTAKELRRQAFQNYYDSCIRSRIPLPA